MDTGFFGNGTFWIRSFLDTVLLERVLFGKGNRIPGGEHSIMSVAARDQAIPLLSVRGLRAHFPRSQISSQIVRAVDGVSFDLARGETLGLVGESGCGKTTLSRALLRLIEPTGGRVTFDGVDVLGAAPGALRNLRRHMQLIFQNPTSALNPRLSIGRSIAEPFVIHNIERGFRLHRRVAELLDRVGLRPRDADRYPHELSGGQKQRVGIARAIALNPKFIVCDEPVSALDVAIQSQILNLLSDLQEELGLTLLFIAHNLAVIKHFCDRVAVMYLGKIVEMASASELYRNPRHPYTQALLQAMPALDPTGPRATRILEGDVPDPARPPDGCPFHPRCPQVTDECRRVAPLLELIPDSAGDHVASCHHASSMAEMDSV